MTNDRSPLDTALDLVLYAPIGLVLTVGEEVPKLATKGRERLATRWATARMVGQFAVAQGRREVQRRTAGAPAPAPRPATSQPTTSQPAVPEPPEPAVPVVIPTEAVAPPPAPSRPTSVPGAPPLTPSSSNGTGGDSADRSASPQSDAVAPAPEAAPSVEDLAIPGYDSLSASQVVQRLAGLASEELEAVRIYEAATRGRRTILARVSQLQGT